MGTFGLALVITIILAVVFVVQGSKEEKEQQQLKAKQLQLEAEKKAEEKAKFEQAQKKYEGIIMEYKKTHSISPEMKSEVMEYLNKYREQMGRTAYTMGMAAMRPSLTSWEKRQLDSQRRRAEINRKNNKIVYDATLAGLKAQQNEARAKVQAQKDAKTIIGSAAVGGIVAGPAGAVVGAVVGKNKADSKK